jgi:GNAT superfamily N-acetyltransferase
MPTQIRPFVRSDRDQLTALVNAHLAAVLPGAALSVQALLSHLESEPGEFIVDRWVAERQTLVADQDDRVVAAAHLRRYADDPQVGVAYAGAGEIAWFCCYPDAPFWAGAEEAGWALLQAAVTRLDAWRVRRAYADGSLPVPSVYGVPDAWPHIAALYARAGFTPGREETILVSPVADLPPRTPNAWSVARQLGTNGVRFSALLEGQRLGYLEVDTTDDGNRFGRPAHADIGNLWVEETSRRRGVATSLLAEAGWWLRLAGRTTLVTYLSEESPESERAFYAATGFEVLTKTRRDWTRGPVS